ncbi:MAG: hypothetical protein JNJ59_20025 [Deltaproteobacteria bacterium]|nr:hypothetical protein [Deltaproteobacteria bacterium]
MWPIVVMLALAAGPEAAPAHGEGIAVRDPSGCVGVIATPLPPGYRVEVEVARAVRSRLRLMVVMRDGKRAVLVRERELVSIDCPHAARLVVAWVEAALADERARGVREGAGEALPSEGEVPEAAGEVRAGPGAAGEVREGPGAAGEAHEGVGEAEPRGVRIVGPRLAGVEGEVGVTAAIGREASVGVSLGLGVREADLRFGLALDGALERTESGWDAVVVELGLGLRWRPWQAPVVAEVVLQAGARGGVGMEVGGVLGLGFGVVWEDVFDTPMVLSVRARWGIVRGTGEGVLDAGLGLGARFGGGARGSPGR